MFDTTIEVLQYLLSLVNCGLWSFEDKSSNGIIFLLCTSPAVWVSCHHFDRMIGFRGLIVQREETEHISPSIMLSFFINKVIFKMILCKMKFRARFIETWTPMHK